MIASDYARLSWRRLRRAGKGAPVPPAGRATLGRVALFAVRCLYANRRRSSLALFGIAVGLAAVVGLSLVGRSAETLALQSFKRLAMDLVTAEVHLESADVGVFQRGPAPGAANPTKPSTRNGRPPLGPAQWQSKLEQLGLVAMGEPAQHWPMQSGMCEISTIRGDESVVVSTSGQGLLDALGLVIESGRDLHPLDGAAPWVVLGAGVATRLRDAGIALAPGSAFGLCGGTAYVAGVLRAPRASSDLLGEPADDTVFVQAQPFRQLGVKPRRVGMIWRLNTEADVPLAVESLRAALRESTDARPSVRSAAAMVALKREQAGQYAKLITLLGGISVLVGGFGIMNVMLVAGLERRYDIAVCMALGADRRAVAWQFLVESTALGMAGGALGVLLGHGLALPALYWLRMPLLTDPGASAVSLAMGALVGAVSGLYPAWRVSRLEPSVVLAS